MTSCCAPICGRSFARRPIGLLVAQGSSSLDFVLRSRGELWAGVPVVFAGVAEETAARSNLPPDVTGTLYQRPFRNAVTTARALVPNLKRIALVGDPWERQAVRRHYEEEIPTFAGEFEFINLIGLPMIEIRKRVAALPDDTAIIYTSVTLDGAGNTYIPHEGLAAFADAANRPIVVDVETNIGHGGTGGLVTTPVPVGEAAARLALRILDGENVSNIPVAVGDFTRPVFDWRQLQRFGISESRLPPGQRDPLSPAGHVGAIPLAGDDGARHRAAAGRADHLAAARAPPPQGGGAASARAAGRDRSSEPDRHRGRPVRFGRARAQSAVGSDPEQRRGGRGPAHSRTRPTWIC